MDVRSTQKALWIRSCAQFFLDPFWQQFKDIAEPSSHTLGHSLFCPRPSFQWREEYQAGSILLPLQPNVLRYMWSQTPSNLFFVDCSGVDKLQVSAHLLCLDPVVPTVLCFTSGGKK